MPQEKSKFVTVMMDVNETYCDNCFAMHMNIASIYRIYETTTVFYFIPQLKK